MTSDQSINIVKNFVGTLTFDEVKLKSESVPYNFKVSEFGNLYMLSFTDDSNLTLDVVRSMNGVIFEKETNDVVHYSFQKTYEGVYSEYCDNNKDAYKGPEPMNYEIEISTEGTHIKVYFYNGEWRVGTSRSIDASISHWNNKKSFKELFFECLNYENIVLSDFDKNLCYSFVMQHPEHTICNDITVPHTSILNTVDTKNNIIVRNTGGFIVDKTINEVLQEIYSENCSENYIVFFQDGKRIKLSNITFKIKQDIIRNDPNMKRVYVRHIQENSTQNIKYYFPENLDLYEFIDYRFFTVVKEIHTSYMNKYIHRTEEEINPKYEKSLKQLHWNYRQTREKNTVKKVSEMLLKLPTKVLLWVLDL